VWLPRDHRLDDQMRWCADEKAREGRQVKVERGKDFLGSAAHYLVGDNDREPLDARSSARRVKRSLHYIFISTNTNSN
jgi:hypothetical protein